MLNQPLLRLSHRAHHGHLFLERRSAVLYLKLVFATHRDLEFVKAIDYTDEMEFVSCMKRQNSSQHIVLKYQVEFLLKIYFISTNSSAAGRAIQIRVFSN